MPEGQGGARRAALSKRFLAGVAVGVALAGIAALALVLVNSDGTSGPKTPAQSTTPASGIDMSRATGFACGAPVAPGPGHPDTLLSQVFNVRDKAGQPYVVGWQIVPFRGVGRSYRFGTPGNLIALEPSTGGAPLGYGKGTVTFRTSAEAGTVDAVITLKAGGSLTVSGSWRCTATSSTTTLPTASTLPAQ